MAERDYYPAGALNDPNAPYNQVELPEYEFEVEYVLTLNCFAKIETGEWDWWNDKPTYDGTFLNDYRQTYKGIKHFLQESLNRKQDERKQLQEQWRVHKTHSLRRDIAGLDEEIAELKMYLDGEEEIEQL